MTDLVAPFLEALRTQQLLDPEQLAAAGKFSVAEPRGLAKELIRRGWLTPYQANQLLQGKGKELRLGGYVLLERLGEGGMGQVFKARHAKLGRIVALKVIRQERLAHPDAVRRFHREIEAASQLSHPNIVHAYDADEDHGTHFFAMEFVEGIDLGKQLKQRGPLPVDEACEYIRQAALGLQHANDKSLVHRDLKPHNLLVCTSRDRQGAGLDKPLPHGRGSLSTSATVKILDFGLARLMRSAEDDGETSSSTLTQEGAVMGTLDYIAPEQALSSHRVDIRADLYSLGCTLYHLLTGRVPFPGGTAMEKLLKHQLESPPPIEVFRADVPTEVCDIVYRLMAKKPEDRNQTPADLVRALSRLGQGAAAGAPTAAVAPLVGRSPIGGGEESLPAFAPVRHLTRRAKSAAARPRWIVPAIGVGAVVLLILLIWALRSPESTTAPSRAEQPTAPLTVTTKPMNESKPGSIPSDWVQLFNGKDLTGWIAHPRNASKLWKVENGDLVGTGTRVGTALISERADLRDFHLRAEIMVTPNGDAGLVFRAVYDSARRQYEGGGYEVDLAPKTDEGLFRWEVAGKTSHSWPAPSPVPADRWFILELLAEGDHLMVKIDGETRVDVMDAKPILTPGSIAIALWTPHAIRVRKLEIRDLRK